MAFDVQQVMGGRDYKVYTKDWDATNRLPADTVAYGTAWGTPSGQTGAWVESGYVDGGLHFTTSTDFNEINVDQELEPVLYLAAGRDTRMTTNLAEFTAANIKSATGQGTITTVAAGSGTPGHDDWDLESTIERNLISIGFDIKHPWDQLPVRVTGWLCQVVGSPTFDFTAEEKPIIPLECALLPDTSTSPSRIARIRNVIAALP